MRVMTKFNLGFSFFQKNAAAVKAVSHIVRNKLKSAKDKLLKTPGGTFAWAALLAAAGEWIH